MEFKKQVGLIYGTDGKLLYVVDLKTILDQSYYNDLKKEAETNLKAKIETQKKDTQDFKESTRQQINKIASAVKVYVNKDKE